MYMPVKRVKPLNDYKLRLTFGDEEERVFDISCGFEFLCLLAA